MEYQKTAEATSDLIGNTIANKITKMSKTSPQNNSESVTNEHDQEKTKEIYMSPEERQKIIDNLRLIYRIIMEYQKIKSLLDNTPSQSRKFITKSWVEINDESQGMYSKDNQIRFKASMLRSSLCVIAMHIYLFKDSCKHCSRCSSK